MSDQSPARRFADALQTFETSGDSSDLQARFADSAELVRPEARKAHVTQDVEAFWDAYLAQFSRIETEFSHIDEGDSHAALEWQSRGALSTGRDIEYRGVSLLTLDDDGRVSRFATYYDTAAFLEPQAADAGS